MSTAVADDTIELCAAAGLVLDEWQQHDLRIMMGQRADGRWSSFEHAEVVARQNGKGSILEARELGGLFLVEERLMLHSAHLAVTSSEAFHRLLNMIEDCPDLDRQLKRVSRSTQDQSIETKNGSRILFKTRTRGGGRGLTADCVILDEAMSLYWPQMAALLPTLSARENPQVVYASSAADTDSEVLHKLRRRALSGDEETFSYCEYSSDRDADPDDPQTWADANPALNIRITMDYLRQERQNLPADEFGRERLTLFDDDHSVAGSWVVVDEGSWLECVQPASEIVSLVALAVEVDRARTWAVVVAAGRNAAGQFHVEVVDSRAGVDWVVDRVAGIVGDADHRVGTVVVDGAGPAGFLVGPLEAAGVVVSQATARTAAQGCGLFATSAMSGDLAHLGDGALSAAVQRAQQRVSGDVWYFRRSGERESIELIAASLAVGQVPSLPESVAVPAPVYAY